MSFGHKKLDAVLPVDFEYDSDHSAKVFRKGIFGMSPEKHDDQTSAEICPDSKITSMSYKGAANKFIWELYNNTTSPVYHGFSYEHFMAM